MSKDSPDMKNGIEKTFLRAILAKSQQKAQDPENFKISKILSKKTLLKNFVKEDRFHNTTN